MSNTASSFSKLSAFCASPKLRRPAKFTVGALAAALGLAAIVPAAAFTPGETAAPQPLGSSIFTWDAVQPAEAWTELVRSGEADRTRAYWRNAVAFLSKEQGAEAIGMLDLLERLCTGRAQRVLQLLARHEARDGLAHVELDVRERLGVPRDRDARLRLELDGSIGQPLTAPTSEDESPVRICMQETGHSRLRCAADILRGNGG